MCCSRNQAGWDKAISRVGNLAVICQRCGPSAGHISNQHSVEGQTGGDQQRGTEHGDGVLLHARLREDPAPWLCLVP